MKWEEAMQAEWEKHGEGYMTQEYRDGFLAGWEAYEAEERGRPQTFICKVCGKSSYPDYRRCAFCGVRGT